MPDPRYTALAALGAATVYEANGQRGAIDPAIKPLDPTSRVAGRAVTIRLEPADNWFIHVGLLHAGPGDVLVVDAGGYVEAGPWGDVLTLAAQQRGLAALVIDGAVRDSQDIIAAGFPVFTRGVCIRKTTKVQRGDVGVPVTIGGQLVHPGDAILGDADGLVVVPAVELDQAIERGHERERKENEMRRRILEGATTLDLLGLPRPR
ncbi:MULTISPECIES: 4-carboxy-4-hydroxy-2-oxoadipate aldolase/oxaloacetate decarboxylase [Microbacterium]|uniref:4-carboxy-4-hydroxy-2-oxoadipate aldolase/oxaloacetate decarboxylase n=1 Tax=Microbacterium TaxID=33882 RepID=UPI0027802E24|nr:MULTISPECIES: 4-carboxy-4-hydroxy-2-oxoadipate aldolase/oxaloacetate decarboxylase [Microbacterium]MDQ1082400.1 4-hydroxy-4-methyl-2-oxoglutarate aldolase [Microbacterium sp. SORGH_AS_0344]MDQ1168829.1 4-hydroxy-4-methyl-2-oxoglutarate aldolase [Microbacterium proteolyticum]